MTSLLFALTTALADAAPSEPVISAASGAGNVGVLAACLSGGAAVVVAAALVVRRRRGRGAGRQGGAAPADKEQGAGS